MNITPFGFLIGHPKDRSSQSDLPVIFINMPHPSASNEFDRDDETKVKGTIF
jgi:hypothetical protein